MTTQPTSTPAARTYEAAHTAAILVDLSRRGRIRVTGRDRIDLLQRLTTNDMKAIAPGQGIANPTAILMSAIMMLRHIDEQDAADRVEKAMLTVFKEGKVLTKDLGGHAKTEEFANEIIDKLRAAGGAAA